MNAGNQLLTIMQIDCNSAVLQATTTLRSAGCQVLQSFDLHSAIETLNGCTCGPDSCACQMIVLLVYDQDGPPETLIFDSHQSRTLVYWVGNPSQSTHPGWIGKITQLLPGSLSTLIPI